VGFVSGSEKSDALAAADIFALPSLNENFGIVLIEAMHAGLPLLISEEVYIKNDIVTAWAGVVCQTTVESVTAKLRHLLEDADEARRMGERGRELVRQRFLPEAVTRELLQLYQETLRSSPGATKG
jgi:glycosyltransferase involved in cell wall biosynthesis